MRRPIAGSPGRAQYGAPKRADPLAAACRLRRAPKPIATFRWSSGFKGSSALTTASRAGRPSRLGASLGGHADRQGAAPAPFDGHEDQKHALAQRALHLINDSTKWTVTAAAAATVICCPTADVLWCITGSVAAAAICKVLKVFINQSRPAGSRLADPGMPSSHANSLGYFGSYVVLSALASRPLVWTAVLRAAAALTVTVVLASLRITLGYHNLTQVAVGLALGCLLAATWRTVLCSCIGPIATTDAAYERLCAVTAVAACLFGVAFIRKWFVAFRSSRA